MEKTTLEMNSELFHQQFQYLSNFFKWSSWLDNQGYEIIGWTITYTTIFPLYFGASNSWIANGGIM